MVLNSLHLLFGMIVGLLVLVLAVVVLVLVLVKTSEHALGKWLNADYAGVSTAGDYEYIVSSLGYAGYDTMITEKNWQEFMAYEYAVLMDVAEYLWEGQNAWNESVEGGAYKDTVMGPYPAEYYGVPEGGAVSSKHNGKNYNSETVTTQNLKGVKEGSTLSIKGTGPAYMPYLPVTQEYNSAALTKEQWDMLVIAGQGSARFGIQDPGAVGNDEFNKSSVIYGGNRDVMPPTLTYEFKSNPYEPDGLGSIVPYINVLKEQLQYFYFTVGDVEKFPDDDAKSGGVAINEGNIEFVDLMEISQVLNIGNPYITNSTVWSQWWENNQEQDPRYETDAWVEADKKYDQNLYFTNMYSSVMYKTALQVMIDRYLPKASLLTSWYYLKDNDFASQEAQGRPSSDIQADATSFKVEELLKDVKSIYNYYCWQDPDESVSNESKDVVVYDPQTGNVLRDGSGAAQVTTESLPMAHANQDTFIHFGQAGIEANLFGVFFRYEPHGKHAAIPKPEAPASITGDAEEKTVPVITEVLSEDAEFMDRFGFKVEFDYTYQYSYEYPVTVGSAGGGEAGQTIIDTASAVVTSDHYHTGGSQGGTFSVDYSCSTCASASYASYSGYTIEYKNTDQSDMRISYTLVKYGPASGGGGGGIDEGTGKPLVIWVTESQTAPGHGKIIIPYEATKDLAPRGDAYQMDEISQYIHDTVVLNAESEMMNMESERKDLNFTESLRKSSDFEIEFQEQELINHGYWYPEKTYKEGEDVHSQPLTFFDERYHHNLGFYNWGAVSGDGAPSEEELKEAFKEEMNNQFTLLESLTTKPNDPFTEKEVAYSISNKSYSEFVNLLKTYLTLLYVETGRVPVEEPPVPYPGNSHPAGSTNFRFDYVTSIDSITSIGGIAENEDGYDQTNLVLRGESLESTGIPEEEYNLGPQYTKVSEQPEPFNAIYDIDDYVLALTMAVPQKRISTMIITDVESWSKSATYKIDIINNTFDYTNYRYVVPHSYFNFGVHKFSIDEKPIYRTNYYKEYFSKVGNQEAGIKEADVLTMMLKWEEFAEAGNETAYAYMRDLYKLIIFIREKFEGDDEQILKAAYSYLYVPDTIWEFREGITQEAFWTERLAAEMPGYPDALTDEELKTVKVRKDEIEWQVLDYDEYEECENGNTAKVYALFPHGSSYVRSYFMQEALTGRFNDGGYMVDGHPSADWLARQTIGNVMNGAFGIMDYEIRLRTARKILAANSTTGDLSAAINALNGDTTSNYYKLAEEEVLAELKEYKVKSPIVSIAAGLVTNANYECYSGFSVAVTHNRAGATNNDECYTSYVHMRRWPNVQTGDIIGPGTIVGYEGTTGNSTGYHLHQNLYVGGHSYTQNKKSPAEYMGPIFAPFYNKQKIQEAITEFADNPMLVLATDYMELYRTVLTYPIEQGVDGLLNGIDYNANTYLQESTIYESGDGNWYLNYADGASNGIPMYQNTDGSVIVKVANGDFYTCQVADEHLSIISGDGDNAEELTCLRIEGTPTVASASDISLGTTLIKCTGEVMKSATIKWGNNVPLEPILQDMENLQDISILNVERMMDPAKYSAEYAGVANNPTQDYEDDVLAKDDFFDITSELVKDRLKVPDWILSFLSDMDSAFAVPFYEGPISVEMQGQVDNGSRDIGFAGTASGDVLALKKALKMKGYAPGDILTLSGDDAGKFDDKLKLVLQTSVAQIDDGYVKKYFGRGELGETPNASPGDDGGEDFGHEGVCYWNAYVTYGSVTASQTVGREACRLGATIAGLRPSFVLSVGAHESSHIPTVDSFLFCSNRQKFNFYTSTPKDSGFVTHRGVDKVIRRAVGLMQIAPPGAIDMAASKLGCEVNDENIEAILRYLRNARTNATLGAEILINMMNLIRANSTYDGCEDGYYNLLKSVVNGNSYFEQMEKDSGIDKYEIAMMGAAALMYNMGPYDGNTAKVINAMSEIVYDGETVTCTDPYGKTGYWVDVMNDVVADGRELLKQLED